MAVCAHRIDEYVSLKPARAMKISAAGRDFEVFANVAMSENPET